MVGRISKKIIGLSNGVILNSNDFSHLENNNFFQVTNNHSNIEKKINQNISLTQVSILPNSEVISFKRIRINFTLATNSETILETFIGINDLENNRIISAFSINNEKLKILKGNNNFVIEIPFEGVTLRGGFYSLTIGFKELYDSNFIKFEFPNFFKVIENKFNFWGFIYSDFIIYKL